MSTPSDHNDGKRFFNPTVTDERSPGFGDLLTFLLKRGARWPRHVENEETPDVNLALKPNDVALTFVNHATFLIQMPGLTILTDPIWSKRASPVRWAGPKRIRKPAIALNDLPPIDVIVISHNHYDHLDIKTLQKLSKRFQPTIIVPFGDKMLLNRAGIINVVELDWWEHIDIDADTRITFTPTQHGSARGLSDRNRSLWGSYFIQHRTRSIYFGGDAAYSSHYTEINNRLGAPDIALLGIGAYLPKAVLNVVHMDPAQAVQAHLDLKAKISIGMHFGTFHLSHEAIDQPPQDLQNALLAKGLSLDSFVTIPEGKTITL